ncbi:MAG: MFS transporter [SAR202 cluster bacterium]|nr:MFS transporter [SAR202 cluster bacterium]
MQHYEVKSTVWSNPRLWAVSLGETLAWAGLFYLFPASLIRWKLHFDWSISELSGGLMIALIVSAITGIGSGKLIDKGLGRELMSGGVVLGGVSLLFMPMVSSLEEFYILWAVVGIAMGACLYDPCFAILTRHYSSQAKEPIVMVTLFAGFSITFSFILSALISSVFNWETSFYVFGVLLCFLAAPLFWIGISADTKVKPLAAGIFSESKSLVSFFRGLIVKPIFWGLSILFTTFALNHIMLISQILPLFENKGVSSTSAVLMASAMGPMQVGGRIALLAIEKYLQKEFEIIRVASFSCVALVCASGLLYYSEKNPLILGLFVVLQGGAFGIINLVKPVITARLLGELNFGFISAVVGVGYIFGFAVAPGVSGFISDAWGTDRLIGTTFLLALVGFVIFSLSATRKINRK